MLLIPSSLVDVAQLRDGLWKVALCSLFEQLEGDSLVITQDDRARKRSTGIGSCRLPTELLGLGQEQFCKFQLSVRVT